jgi:hypothetical protein
VPDDRYERFWPGYEEELADRGIPSPGPARFAWSMLIGLATWVLAIAPAILIDAQPWKAIAIANAVAHILAGFVTFSTVPTGRSAGIRLLARGVWRLTIATSVVLLVAGLLGT